MWNGEARKEKTRWGKGFCVQEVLPSEGTRNKFLLLGKSPALKFRLKTPNRKSFRASLRAAEQGISQLLFRKALGDTRL